MSTTARENEVESFETGLNSSETIDSRLNSVDFDDNYAVVSQAYKSLEEDKITVWSSIYDSSDEIVSSGTFTVDRESYGLEEGEKAIQLVERRDETETGLREYAEEILGRDPEGTEMDIVMELQQRYQNHAEESDHLEEMELFSYDKRLQERLEDYEGLCTMNRELPET